MTADRLIDAVESRKLAAVRERIDAGADLNGCNARGRTALLVAVHLGNVEMVEMLLDAGADPGAHDRKAERRSYEKLGSRASPKPRGPGTLLHQAAIPIPAGGAVVRALLERGYDIDARDVFGATPLMFAAQVLDDEASTFGPLEVLLQAGADVNALDRAGRSALSAATRVWALERLLAAGADPNGGEWSREHSGDRPLLAKWAQLANDRALDALIRAGAEVRKHPGALTEAAWAGHVPSMDVLLRAGADPDEGTPGQYGLFSNEMPAIGAAAIRGHLAAVKRLIAAGTKHLDYAVFCAAGGELGGMDIRERLDERLGTVRALIDAGASPNAHRDGIGRAALHGAAEKALVRVVDALIAAGATVDAVDNSGATPLWRAAENGCAEVVEHLVRAGANPKAATSHGVTPYAIAKKSSTPHLKDLVPGSREQLRVLSILRDAGGAPDDKPAATATGTPSAPVGQTASALSAGDRVRHAKFGEGVVMSRSGSGPEAKVVVSFGGVGKKQLLAKFLQAVPIEKG